MEHVLRTVASFETHKAHWLQKRQDRQAANHIECGQPMSRMTHPSCVRLFQLALAQVHSNKFMQHFGSATIEDILHTPIRVLAEQEGVAASAAVATDFQINLFTDDTRMALGYITSAMGKIEVVGFVQQAREFQGSGMFMFVLGRAVKHVAEHAKTGKTPSPFACSFSVRYPCRATGESAEAATDATLYNASPPLPTASSFFLATTPSFFLTSS